MKPVVNYFKQSWQELGKISWPSREQTIRLTVAVVIFSLLMAAFIGAIDFGLANIVKRFIVR